MYSPDEFRDLYHSDIEPVLRKMEENRKWALKSAAIGLFALILIFNSKSSAADSKFLLLLFAIGAGIFGLVKYNEYKRDFKYKIIGRIVKLINPDYKFFDHRHFKLDTVLKSGLYYNKPDVINGDDFVNGRVDGRNVEFCELNFGQAVASAPTDFKGLFFKIDLHRPPASDITVFPDWHGNLKNYNNRDFEKELGPILNLPWDFKERFSVFCHDEKEAYQFVGPNMQKAIVGLQQEINKKIHLSFQKDYLYCTVSFDKKLFEPVIWYSTLNPDPVLECFELFSIPEKIIHHLTLTDQQIEDDRMSYIHPKLDVKATNKSIEEEPEPVLSEAPEEIVSASTEVVIDRSLDLPLLAQQISGLKKVESDYDLQTYLQALYGNILSYKDEVFTQKLLIELLTSSFSSEPIPMEEPWLKITQSPEIDKSYRKTKRADDLGFFSKPEHRGWSNLAFTEEVLQFQIAELHKMRGNQLENDMKQYGVASETGTPWYNFDPVSNMTSGIKLLIAKDYEPDKIDWSIIGLIFQLGRVNS